MTCEVSPDGNYNVFIRATPSLTAAINGRIFPGHKYPAIKETHNGATWFRLETGEGYVLGSVVRSYGDCDSPPPLPDVPCPELSIETPVDVLGAMIRMREEMDNLADRMDGWIASVNSYPQDPGFIKTSDEEANHDEPGAE